MRDSYVGIMKAVILGIAPEVRLIDLCHRIRPQDIYHGALMLWSAMDVFQPGMIHVVVVDPGVGGHRRGVMVEAGGQLFIGPDNGVLWPAVSRFPSWRAVSLTERVYQREVVSATFHGRDIFGPAAGHACAGVPMEAFGPSVEHLTELVLFDAQQAPGRVRGRILCFDHFGNAITNISQADFKGQTPTSLYVGGHHVKGWSRTFSDVERGAPLGFLDSFGLVEVAVREGSAQSTLPLKRDDEVEVLFS